MLQFRNTMRHYQIAELTGPLVEILAAIGVGWALLYVYAANLQPGVSLPSSAAFSFSTIQSRH